MALLYVTTDMLKWGAGTGAPLSASQIDLNFWQLHERVLALETDPPTAVGISNIQVIGSQLTITLSDATSFGPYTLPTATFESRGEAVESAAYYELDVVSVVGHGLYLVLIDHTMVFPFDPDRVISGNPVYKLLFGDDPYRYDFGPFIPDKPGLGITPGKRIFSHLFKTDVYFPIDFVGSEFLLETAPAADLEFPIRHNASVIGTLTFAAASINGVFDVAAALQLVDGDRLSLMTPTGGVDAAALELTGTFVGRRGLLAP